jgi:Pyruvate/2-oxoacid:ferredoxin oxidoreductase gamma subunit
MAHFEVLMAGTGGQGLVFCSSFLAEAHRTG